MKIVCAKNEMIDAIAIVSKAVSNRTPVPILECILLKADESGLKLIANDMELGIETAPIASQIEEQGSVCLESKMFSEIIRKLPDTQVAIHVDQMNVTRIISGKSEFKLIGQSAEEFPVLPLVEKNINYKIPSVTLKNLIRQTIFSVALEETRPVLTGELFEIKNNQLSLVAVDGFRVSVRSVAIESENEDKKVVIPAKTLNEISKILSTEKESEVMIYFTDCHVLFELETGIVVSRLLEGDFIKYEQAFATDAPIRITAKRHELLSCLERASLVARDAKKSPVSLKLDPRYMVISAQTDMGVFNEEIQVGNDYEELEISFNPKYLLDVLKVVESEEVIMNFSTPLSPCIIKGFDTTDYSYLVLPLRQKS